MWRSINFVLILLCLFGRVNFLQAQKVQTEKETANEQLNCNDRTNPAYFDNLSYLPVKFISRHKESEMLVAQFTSPIIFAANQIKFKLVPETKGETGLFFRVNGEWEEEISRKNFLKKLKEDFWVVSYLTIDKDKVICNAHQFKNWLALQAS